MLILLSKINRILKKHLEKLKYEFTGYFPEWKKFNCVQKIIQNFFVQKSLKYCHQTAKRH